MDEALHDRFICGLHLESVQKKLLLEKDLTMASVLKHANCISSAERTSRAMNSSKAQNQPVHIVRGKQTSGRCPCYRCGRNSHNSDQCQFREANCHMCGKVGHVAPVCMSGQKKEHQKFNNGPKSNAHHKGKQRENTYLDTNASEVSHSDEEPLFTVEEKSHPPIIIKLKLNEQVTEMELDTGAAMSLISESTQKLFPDVTLRPSEVTLRTYTSKV